MEGGSDDAGPASIDQPLPPARRPAPPPPPLAPLRPFPFSRRVEQRLPRSVIRVLTRTDRVRLDDMHVAVVSVVAYCCCFHFSEREFGNTLRRAGGNREPPRSAKVYRRPGSVEVHEVQEVQGGPAGPPHEPAEAAQPPAGTRPNLSPVVGTRRNLPPPPGEARGRGRRDHARPHCRVAWVGTPKARRLHRARRLTRRPK